MNSVSFEWSDSLAVGWPAIDAEHRELIRLINELAALHRSDAQAQALNLVFRGLYDYAVQHFRNEDVLMRSGEIPAGHVHRHRRAHDGFVACLDRAERLIDNKPLDVVSHLLAFLVQWLVHHITGVDVELARLLRAASGVESVAVRTAPAADGLQQPLVETINGLYERIGVRTFELLELNHQLEHEIEHTQRAESELRRSEARFAALYRFAPVALWDLDRSGARAGATGSGPDLDDARRAPVDRVRLVDANEAALRQAGVATLEALRQRPLSAWLGESILSQFEQAEVALVAGRPFECEVELLRDDGARRHLAVNLFAVPGSGDVLDRVIAASVDITGLRLAEEQMRQLAMHDSLTQLPNRLLFSDRLAHALRVARRKGRRLALAFVDLDRFKPVNDTLGHESGDELLRQVAKRLTGAVRESDTVARVGGDEFMVLLLDVVDGDGALAVARKVHQALRQPFELKGVEVSISSSIGVALFPEHGDDEATLARSADAAMYEAKLSGRDAVRSYVGNQR